LVLVFTETKGTDGVTAIISATGFGILTGAILAIAVNVTSRFAVFAVPVEAIIVTAVRRTI
jgi:hypothetical protein